MNEIMFKAKKVKRLTALLAAALMLAGCGEGVYSLPKNAKEFEQTTYVNEKDEGDTYMAINYGGREYVYYGSLKNKMREDDVYDCIGYTDGDENERLCVLRTTKDYIMQRYVNGFMDLPIFYRAEDTMGEEIYTPGYIQCVECKLWDSENDGDETE